MPSHNGMLRGHFTWFVSRRNYPQRGGTRPVTAVQHARDHIRCNSVHPGGVDTPMRQEGLADLSPAERDERLRRVPMGRVGMPEEIAYGVLYLASDESSFVTGSELVIDGGYIAQ
jgi:NAD(P)-dependent dehydrogenase (short-subunit alcohol dehydrogenase family)